MTFPTENESWVINAGGEVITKMTKTGLASLTTWEKLLYCLWVADYGMRNAGDLGAAQDLYADFISEAHQAVKELSLPLALEMFSLSQSELEKVYFDRFEAVCQEIRNAEAANDDISP